MSLYQVARWIVKTFLQVVVGSKPWPLDVTNMCTFLNAADAIFPKSLHL